MDYPIIAPPLIGCLILVIAYILSGAAVIAEAQPNWSYNDALYYCFVSLFTVGMGGIRPQEPNLWMCAMYLLLGMTLMSTCGHILHQEVTSSLQKYRNNVKQANMTKQRMNNRILLTELESVKPEIS